MFLGQFRYSIDEKGRLMIPARFREALQGGAYLTQGFDKCLMVMTEVYFQEVYERLNAMNLTDPIARILRRLLLASAYQVEVDRVGRILLPANLREFAVLENAAVIVGQGEYFEVWAPDEWQKQLALITDVDSNLQRFAALDLSAKRD